MAQTPQQLLSQLVVPQGVTYFFNLLLSTYQAQGFPVQSWQVGGVERTRLMSIATAMADKATNYAPAIASGILLDFSTSDGKGGGWLPLTAQEFFGLTQNPAVNTQGNITLTAASGVGTQTLQAGQLIAVFAATGNRYLNTGTVVIPAGPGNVTAQFQAEFPGASYNDPSSSGALTLVTPIPGVTLTNPASTYGTVVHTGSGTGSLTLGGSPVGPHSVAITITATGQSGTASWQYVLDGGTAVSAGQASSLTNIGGTGINITLTNGGSGTSFALNDTFSFSTPGSWITQQGANIEADATLAQRCRNRWPSLSAIPTTGLYQLLAQSTPSVGAQVTQVIVVPDANINNKVNIIIAGPAGPLPGAVVTAVQNYISPRVPITVLPVVGTPSTIAITIVSTVNVTASLLASVQAAVTTALTNYIASVGINGTIQVSEIITLIRNVTGVVNVQVPTVTINGSAADLTLGGPSTFVMPSLTPAPTLTITYIGQ